MQFGPLINSLSFGKAQEAKAARYLRSRGLRLLDRNYRSRYGEIDLIMADSQTLVFVEVRYRSNRDYGNALASVTVAKQRKIRLTAAQYLQSHPKLQNCCCRFDVVGLGGDSARNTSASKARVDWIKNAFE